MARQRAGESIESADGRVRRGAQNRGRILDALYELVGEGDLQPTAEQVARRAGVGERTVFRHFEDMETLHAELSERLAREIRPLLQGPPISGTRKERVRELVARRSRLFESIAPFHRSAALHRPHSSFLQRAHAENCRLLREDVTRAFESELEGDDGRMLEALDLLLSLETFDRLRCEQRLGRERTARVVESASLRVLGQDK